MIITFIGDWTYQNYTGLNPKIMEKFDNSDLVLYNFETAINFGGVKKEKAYNFSARYDTKFYITENTICHLANNHIIDSGLEDVKKTIEFIQKKGKIIGIISERLNSKPFTIIMKKGKKIGILGCTQFNEKNDIFHFLIIGSEEYYSYIKELSEMVDFLIVSVHWGQEQVFIPSKKQVLLARKSVDIGVDLFVGHHSHVFQPYEIYKGKHIFFSIGNFQIPVTISEFEIRQKYSNIIEYNLGSNKIKLIPIYLDCGNPHIIENDNIQQFYKNFRYKKYMQKWSYLHSIPVHYKQNWDSWKKRIRLYGIKEFYICIKQMKNRSKIVGLFCYIIFLKLCRINYDPLIKAIREEK